MKLWTYLDVWHVVALVVRPILSLSDAWSISWGSRTRVRKAQRRGAVKSDLIDFQHLSICMSETNGSNYKSHNPQQSILARKPALRTVLTRIEGCSSTKTSQGTGGEDHNQRHMVSFPPKATKSAGSVWTLEKNMFHPVVDKYVWISLWGSHLWWK